MVLSFRDVWVKAAVEHVILTIMYRSKKGEITTRDVEPDFIVFRGSTLCYYAAYCHLRHEGPRCFQPSRILGCSVTDRTFQPSPKGRWRELLPLYQARGLAMKGWGEGECPLPAG
ncbi:MAG: WYL domain-containing protein [Methanomicrobiaceae archaeon]|uniref:WYL domain-containing protein n=1 Tax=hydrocarbon metagenome TaxID=938273 RepID=A0A0W8FID8_9ZZZZ|nr:WYL domain-containing protein [Methanomicrobiaceae archaeon]MDD5419157.1 WYL domain-containing protein [Methanomicrobiaceae archaeon]